MLPVRERWQADLVLRAAENGLKQDQRESG